MVLVSWWFAVRRVRSYYYMGWGLGLGWVVDKDKCIGWLEGLVVWVGVDDYMWSNDYFTNDPCCD
jgi:hypothetical protein